MLYQFEKKLHLILFNELEKIEAAVRYAQSQLFVSTISISRLHYYILNKSTYFQQLSNENDDK